MMKLLSSLISIPLRGAADIRARRFLNLDPVAAQRELLPGLLRKASETNFGRASDFRKIASLPFEKAYSVFSQEIPIRTYQQFWEEWFSESFIKNDKGQQLSLNNVSWPGVIPWLCETSGTTAPTKLIPFSAEMFRMNQRAALDMICCYMASNPASRLTGGKILYMAGSTRLKDMGAGVVAGDMSAITLAMRPAWINRYVEPKEPLASAGWDERLCGMAELLLNDPEIRVISGVPPWIILLLQKVESLSGRKVTEALPNLELIIHGGASKIPYNAEFQRLFSSGGPEFIELLPSSEAFIGFQVYGENRMRLTPFYGTFFEFVPIEQLDESGAPLSSARAVPLEQIETGQRYAVILTTCSGLWRYHIGDTLRFLDKERFQIEFTGRDRFLDRFEEKVTQGEVEQAVASLNEQYTGLAREFMVGADIPGRRHKWVLACRGELVSSDLVSDFLDNQLCRGNADYATFREQGRINRPEVLLLPEEEIYDWSLKVRGKLGGQNKIPHIDPTLTGELVKSLYEYVEDGSIA